MNQWLIIGLVLVAVLLFSGVMPLGAFWEVNLGRTLCYGSKFIMSDNLEYMLMEDVLITEEWQRPEFCAVSANGEVNLNACQTYPLSSVKTMTLDNCYVEPDPDPEPQVECGVSSDCLGSNHESCNGQWQCLSNECVWQCDQGGDPSPEPQPEPQNVFELLSDKIIMLILGIINKIREFI